VVGFRSNIHHSTLAPLLQAPLQHQQKQHHTLPLLTNSNSIGRSSHSPAPLLQAPAGSISYRVATLALVYLTLSLLQETAFLTATAVATLLLSIIGIHPFASYLVVYCYGCFLQVSIQLP